MNHILNKLNNRIQLLEQKGYRKEDMKIMIKEDFRNQLINELDFIVKTPDDFFENFSLFGIDGVVEPYTLRGVNLTLSVINKGQVVERYQSFDDRFPKPLFKGYEL